MEEVRKSARDRLLLAGAQLLSEQGIDVSTRAICEAAGVTAPTLYHHFADRAALLAAVVDLGFNDYLARKRGIESSGDPLQDLRHGWDDHIAWGTANPAFYALMYGQARPGQQSPAADEAEQLLAQRLEAAGRAGLLRVPADLGVRMIMSANVGLTLQLIRNPNAARDNLSVRVRESTFGAVLVTEVAALVAEASGSASALAATAASGRGVGGTAAPGAGATAAGRGAGGPAVGRGVGAMAIALRSALAGQLAEDLPLAPAEGALLDVWLDRLALG